MNVQETLSPVEKGMGHGPEQVQYEPRILTTKKVGGKRTPSLKGRGLQGVKNVEDYHMCQKIYFQVYCTV